MGFYIRKSISVGPFRFNLSRAGLGMSVGIKGLRISTGPRGNYIQMGRGGFYYRTALFGTGRMPHPATSAVQPPRAPKRMPPCSDRTEATHLTAVETGDVLEMKPTNGSDIVSQINQSLKAIAFWPFSIGVGVSISVAAWIYVQVDWLVIGLLGATAIASGFFAYRDRIRRTVVLMYELDDESVSSFKSLVEEFDRLKAKRIWNIDASGAISDWKRNAGASRLIKRGDARLTFGEPKFVRTNVNVPAIRGGRQSVYFLPDVTLIVEGAHAGALTYDQLSLSWQPTVFIEEESVPSDSEVIGYTWQFVNKSGRPDKRFRNNRQIPKVRYLQMELLGPGGLQKILQFSRVLDHSEFDSSLEALRRLIGALSATQSAAKPVKMIPPASHENDENYAEFSAVAKQLRRDKLDFWEYKLTVEYLRLWSYPVIQKWNDLSQGRYELPARVVRRDSIIRWCRDRLGDIPKFARLLVRLIKSDLEAAWGPPGCPGNADQIEMVCRRITQLSQDLLNWEESVRFATVPPAFEEVRTLLQGSAGLLLDQITKVYTELSNVFMHGGEPSGKYHIALTVELPEHWNEMFELALGRAIKSVSA